MRVAVWCLKACAADASTMAEVGESRSDRKSCCYDRYLRFGSSGRAALIGNPGFVISN